MQIRLGTGHKPTLFHQSWTHHEPDRRHVPGDQTATRSRPVLQDMFPDPRNIGRNCTVRGTSQIYGPGIDPAEFWSLATVADDVRKNAPRNGAEVSGQQWQRIWLTLKLPFNNWIEQGSVQSNYKNYTYKYFEYSIRQNVLFRLNSIWFMYDYFMYLLCLF